MLQLNQMAPTFSLPDQAGRTVSLASFKGRQWVVLYFYPKDDTPGCTIEANQFTTLADAFAAQDTVVLGVSKDSSTSHQQFIDKHQLKVDLIADTEGQLCEQYGVWQEKARDGVKKMGIVRSTFIIDKSGKLVDLEYNVKPDGHAQAVLAKIAALNEK